MKKLLKTDSQTIDALVSELGDAKDDVIRAIETANAEVAKANAAIAAYNEILDSARELKEEVTGRMEDYVSERSEAWHDSDSGRAFAEWQSTWNDFDADKVDEIDDIEEPDMSHGDALADLPREVDQ